MVTFAACACSSPLVEFGVMTGGSPNHTEHIMLVYVTPVSRPISVSSKDATTAPLTVSAAENAIGPERCVIAEGYKFVM